MCALYGHIWDIPFQMSYRVNSIKFLDQWEGGAFGSQGLCKLTMFNMHFHKCSSAYVTESKERLNRSTNCLYGAGKIMSMHECLQGNVTG